MWIASSNSSNCPFSLAHKLFVKNIHFHRIFVFVECILLNRVSNQYMQIRRNTQMSGKCFAVTLAEFGVIKRWICPWLCMVNGSSFPDSSRVSIGFSEIKSIISCCGVRKDNLLNSFTSKHSLLSFPWHCWTENYNCENPKRDLTKLALHQQPN